VDCGGLWVVQESITCHASSNSGEDRGYYTPLSTLHTPLIGRIWLWAVVDEDPIGNNAVGDGVHASRNKEMKMAQSVMVPDSVGRSTFPERYLPP
jgi:hypothetical protein